MSKAIIDDDSNPFMPLGFTGSIEGIRRACMMFILIGIVIGIGIGIGLVVCAIYDFYMTIRILKSRIEVDALVIGNEERPGPGDDGPMYHLVFRYWVNGEPFETRYSTSDDQYKLSSIHRIYCYKNDPKKIILPRGIINNTLIKIFCMIMGVFLIYMGIGEFIG